jgi:hypothetical protein
MIIDTIERLMAGRTVLLITHGPGWLGGAGRTLTLDQGRLVLAAGCFGTVPGGTGPGGTGPGGTGPGSTGSGGHALAASS